MGICSVAHQAGAWVHVDGAFVLVRFDDSDDVTQYVITTAQRDGVMWLGASQWHDQLVARISVCNHATTAADVQRCAKALLAAYGAVAPVRS